MELVDGRPLSDLIADGRQIDPEQARLLALQVADGARRRPPRRRGAPRREAGQPAGHARRQGEDHRLRHRPGRRLGRLHPDRPDRRHARTTSPPSRHAASRRRPPATSTRSAWCSSSASTERAPSSRTVPIATALAHIRDEVPPLPDEVPPALAAVVRRALEKDPAARYADGAAFAAALREAGEPGAVVPPPSDATRVMGAPVPAAAAVAAAPDTAPTPAAQVTTTKTQNRWPLYAAGAVVLLVLLALLIAHPWTDDTRPTSRPPEPTRCASRRPTTSGNRSRTSRLPWPTRA